MSNRKYKKKYYIGLDSFGNKLYRHDIVELKPYWWMDDKTYLSPIYWTGPLHGAFVQNTLSGYSVGGGKELIQVQEFYYSGAWIKKVKSYDKLTDEEVVEYNNKFKNIQLAP